MSWVDVGFGLWGRWILVVWTFDFVVWALDLLCGRCFFDGNVMDI